MGDMGDYWRDVRPFMKARSASKRPNNREASAEILREAGVKFTSKNDGIHLIVEGKVCLIDFWPGTGKFITRLGKKGRGVISLLAHC